MGLVSPDRQYVICRSGVLARIRDYLDGHAQDYMIDVPVFPGNSGGPVILCPSAIAINGTNPISESSLVGIVKSYVPYTDVAISPQTNRPRISFEENSGLAMVESLDSIVETVQLGERDLLRQIREAELSKPECNQPAEATKGETMNPDIAIEARAKAPPH
jgi:hypothetical protein